MVNRAFIAALMTTIIFVSGFSVGMLWDSLRREKIQSELDEISVYSTSLFLESQLLDNVTCSSYLPILRGAMEDLDESLGRYEHYDDSSIFDLDSKRLLYQRYLLSNVRLWSLAERYRDTCEWDVSSVLFFFAEECEGNCMGASTQLNYLKQKYGERLLIFPIQRNLAGESPVANTLAAMYGVESLPAIIIDGEKYGYMPLEDMEELVCQRMNCSGV